MFGKLFKVPVPNRPPVPAGKTRICVAGFGASHNVSRAKKVASLIAEAYPDKYETWFYFSTFQYQDWVKTFIAKEIPNDQKDKKSTMDSDRTIGEHKSAPFVWLENVDNGLTALGGRDMFCEWAAKEFPDDEAIHTLARSEPSMKEMFFDNKTPAGTWMNE